MAALKQRLYTPGPTTVPEEVLRIMSAPVMHHRTPEFTDMFARIQDNLRYAVNTSCDVITLSASGTGAMEAAVVNALAPGDTALVVDNGKFSHRWYELCTGYGIRTVRMELPWGASPEPAALGAMLKEYPDVAAVFATQCETSTGALSDIEALGRAVKANGSLFVVDAITGVGIHPLRPDEWGVDICVTGSQKGLMTPPGLSFVAVSPAAWDKMERGALPSYYFDLRRARAALHKGQTPFSPASTLIRALDEALNRFRSEGREAVWARHAATAAAMRAGTAALGLGNIAAVPGNVLTAVALPDAPAVAAGLLDRHGIRVAGGQGPLKGKIIRISHTGYADHLDVIAFLAAFEDVLARHGRDITPGAGITAAQSLLYQNTGEPTQ